MVLWGLIIPILVFLLVFNGSYAYFTATAKAQNSTTTTAIIKIGFTDDIATTIKESGATVTRAKLIPGDSVTFKGTVQNTGTADLYAIVSYELEVIKTDNTSSVVKSGYLNAVGSELVLGDGVYTTAATLMAVNAINSFEVSHEFDFFEYDNTYKNAQVIFRAKAQAIQQSNIASASAATFILMEKFNPVPAEYKQLTYLESTGTQYIDMKYAYRINDELNIDFMLKSSPGAIQGIFGNGNLSQYTGTVLYVNTNNILTCTIGGTLGTEFYKYEQNTIALDTKYNVRYSGKDVYLDETKIITVSNTLKNGTQEDFSLFRRWGTNGLYGRIYKFSIKRDGEYLFLMTPCIRKSDNVAGMYDAVNRVFYTNAGTGEFVAGDDYYLTDDDRNYYQRVEYIQSTGKQYIDTGVSLSSGTRMVADIVFKDGTANTYSGAHILANDNRYFFGSMRKDFYHFGVAKQNLRTSFAYGGRDIVECYWASGNSYMNVNNGTPFTRNETFTDDSSYKFYMFGANRDGTGATLANITAYSWKWYQNDVLVRDFIPVKRIGDGEVGMFDAVNRVFYTNAGTGDFVAGPNV